MLLELVTVQKFKQEYWSISYCVSNADKLGVVVEGLYYGSSGAVPSKF